MKIAIIGAGIAGLAVASFLSSEHDVRIFETVPEPKPMGAGLLLQPPGQAILEELGILSEVEEQSAKITKLNAQTVSGKKLLSLDYSTLSSDLFGLGVARQVIWQALYNKVIQRQVPVIADSRVLDVQEQNNSALLRFDKRTESFDMVIIASGSSTELWQDRKSHISNLYPWGCLWTTVDLPPEWPRDCLEQRCLKAKHLLGVLPLGKQGDTFKGAFYWSMKEDQFKAWQTSSFTEWRRNVKKIWPQAEALIEGITPDCFNFARYRDIWSDPPSRGRVVAIGDAAHGTSPQLGQGTTAALRDASALARHLRENGNIELSLRNYWKERKKTVQYYRWASRLLTPVFQSDSILLAGTRDLLAPPLGRLPLFNNQALLTLCGIKTGLFHSSFSHKP